MNDNTTDELIILTAFIVASNRVASNRVASPNEEIMPPDTQTNPVVTQPVVVQSEIHTWMQTIGIIITAAVLLWGKVSPYILGTTNPTPVESNTVATMLDVIKTLSQAPAPITSVPVATPAPAPLVTTTAPQVNASKQVTDDVVRGYMESFAAVNAAIAKGQTSREVLTPLAVSTFSNVLNGSAKTR